MNFPGKLQIDSLIYLLYVGFEEYSPLFQQNVQETRQSLVLHKMRFRQIVPSFGKKFEGGRFKHRGPRIYN